MTNASPLDKHLAPGERVLWSGDVIDQLYRDAVSDKLLISFFLFVVFAAITAVLGVAAENLLRPEPPPQEVPPSWRSASWNIELTRPLGTPLCLFALGVSAFVALIQLGRVIVLLNAKQRPKARAFVVTSHRLLALGDDGALLDQAAPGEIAGVEPMRRNTPHTLIVRRRRGKNALITFEISWVARPAEAKAIIEQTFLSPAPKTTA